MHGDLTSLAPDKARKFYFCFIYYAKAFDCVDHHKLENSASQVALVVKNLPANSGDRRDVVRSVSWEVPLEEEMATHSSILVWKISRIEEPGGLQSMGLQRVRHN